jgi:hypothetical protein
MKKRENWEKEGNTDTKRQRDGNREKGRGNKKRQGME